MASARILQGMSLIDEDTRDPRHGPGAETISRFAVAGGGPALGAIG
jgi:hypothetical protein